MPMLRQMPRRMPTNSTPTRACCGANQPWPQCSPRLPIPLTIGFIAKFYVVAAGVDGAAWTLIWALIVGSAIGVYYYLRIVFALTKREDADKNASRQAPRIGKP